MRREYRGHREWEVHWGNSYDEETKKQIFSRLFWILEKDHKIGDVVVDFGSGKRPVSQYLPEGHKVLLIDIAGEESFTQERYQIKLDIENIGNDHSMSFKKALVKSAEYLGLDPRSDAARERVDMMIFSEILNYVDYQRVVKEAVPFLKAGGRMVILNMPNRGISRHFSEARVVDNQALKDFLRP